MTKKKIRINEIFLYALIFLCSLVAALFLIFIIALYFKNEKLALVIAVLVLVL